MVTDKYIYDFEKYAAALSAQYQSAIACVRALPRQKQLWQLELSMHRMENDLNGKKAEVIGHIQSEVGFCDEAFEDNLAGIIKQELKKMLQRNLQSMSRAPSAEKDISTVIL